MGVRCLGCAWNHRAIDYSLIHTPLLSSCVQAVVKTLDKAIPLGMVIVSTKMIAVQERQELQVTGRNELRAILGGQSEAGTTSTGRETIKDRLLKGCQGIYGAAASGEIPTDDVLIAWAVVGMVAGWTGAKARGGAYWSALARVGRFKLRVVGGEG